MYGRITSEDVSQRTSSPGGIKARLPTWLVHFDGLYEPRYTDRGIATYGFVARHGPERMGEGKGVVAGPGTGASANAAEFGALVHALTWLEANKRAEDPVVVRGESRLALDKEAGRRQRP